MDRIARESLLYDFYGALLTDKKRQVMEMYHEDDMSLAEIADDMGITRAAVYDSLKSAEQQLEHYEEKLGLLAKYEADSELARKADEIIEKAAIGENDAEKLREIIEKLAAAEAV
ncbi:MAG: YlxM family DNA-binding protein [Eubacterium sp.]|nr:YlxM family DNA-binding protein [Eubacterium sp.]